MSRNPQFMREMKAVKKARWRLKSSITLLQRSKGRLREVWRLQRQKAMERKIQRMKESQELPWGAEPQDPLNVHLALAVLTMMIPVTKAVNLATWIEGLHGTRLKISTLGMTFEIQKPEGCRLEDCIAPQVLPVFARCPVEVKQRMAVLKLNEKDQRCLARHLKVWGMLWLRCRMKMWPQLPEGRLLMVSLWVPELNVRSRVMR